MATEPAIARLFVSALARAHDPRGGRFVENIFADPRVSENEMTAIRGLEKSNFLLCTELRDHGSPGIG